MAAFFGKADPYASDRFLAEDDSVIPPVRDAQKAMPPPRHVPPRNITGRKSQLHPEGRSGVRQSPVDTSSTPSTFRRALDFVALVIMSALTGILVQIWLPAHLFPPFIHRLLEPRLHSRCTNVTIIYPPQMAFSLVANLENLSLFNYALKQCGAEVIPELTFAHTPSPYSTPYRGDPTHGSWPHGGLGGEDLLKQAGESSPEYALDGDILSSNCWEFRGAHGQLGFTLVDVLDISFVSVDHELTLGTQSAPRSMVLWGVVDGEESMTRYAESQASLAQLRAHLPTGIADPAPAGYTYVPIAVIEYNPHLSTTHQYFPVFRDIKLSQLSFGIVVLQVVGNWGGPVTHLCRVGIHGTPTQAEA